MSSKSTKSTQSTQSNKNIKQLLKDIDSISKKDFQYLLDELSDAYFNTGESIVSDDDYDRIISVYEKRFDSKYTRVGAPVGEDKVKLPKYLGSLNKIREEKEFLNWKKKYDGPYFISDKVDGVSALTNGTFLYTRGDGNIGRDISHLLPFLDIPKVSKGLVRGEIVMYNSVFNKKYKNKFANARNTTSGIVNAKHPDKNMIKDLVFLAYEYDLILSDENESTEALPCSTQFKKLESMGFKLPCYNKFKDITITELKDVLTDRKKEGDYDIDGLVIFQDKPQKIIWGENPKYAIAFKMTGDTLQTRVEYVEWNASKHGILKPRVKLETTNLSGVDINWATGFNAKFIKDNKIGEGAIVEITRSGDVIPYITNIIKKAEKADMPKDVDYIWNDTGVEILVAGESDDTNKRKIVEFFKIMGVKFLGESTINKLYEYGFNTLKKIFNLTKDDLLEVEGIKDKGAERILKAIKESIKGVDIKKVIHASGTLGIGFGERKLEALLEEFPDVFVSKLSRENMIKKIEEIKGFKKTATQFVDNLPKVKEFFKSHPEIVIGESEEEEDLSSEESDYEEEEGKESLEGKGIVFTGFRDEELEKKIKKKGGKIQSGVSKNTDILVVKQRYEGTSKEKKAEELEINILTKEQFLTMYL